eukprot:scaffold20626_cov105-Isochrysis_galbana.AAC.5
MEQRRRGRPSRPQLALGGDPGGLKAAGPVDGPHSDGRSGPRGGRHSLHQPVAPIDPEHPVPPIAAHAVAKRGAAGQLEQRAAGNACHLDGQHLARSVFTSHRMRSRAAEAVETHNRRLWCSLRLAAAHEGLTQLQRIVAFDMIGMRIQSHQACKRSAQRGEAGYTHPAAADGDEASGHIKRRVAPSALQAQAGTVQLQSPPASTEQAGHYRSRPVRRREEALPLAVSELGQLGGACRAAAPDGCGGGGSAGRGAAEVAQQHGGARVAEAHL